jgi:hypothetical protein
MNPESAKTSSYYL